MTADCWAACCPEGLDFAEEGVTDSDEGCSVAAAGADASKAGAVVSEACEEGPFSGEDGAGAVPAQAARSERKSADASSRFIVKFLGFYSPASSGTNALLPSRSAGKSQSSSLGMAAGAGATGGCSVRAAGAGAAGGCSVVATEA